MLHLSSELHCFYVLHRRGALIDNSQVVFIESINGIHSTKHTKHTSAKYNIPITEGTHIVLPTR